MSAVSILYGDQAFSPFVAPVAGMNDEGTHGQSAWRPSRLPTTRFLLCTGRSAQLSALYILRRAFIAFGFCLLPLRSLQLRLRLRLTIAVVEEIPEGHLLLACFCFSHLVNLWSVCVCVCR